MRIGIFSDVHGRLRIVLHLLRNWQMAHMQFLDVALVGGDLGCFPDPAKFDKATRRWIERDPEEAGFSRYFVTPTQEVKRIFQPEFGEYSAVRCPVLFVPGNHEDFDHITAASKSAPAGRSPKDTFPVDCYQRFHCINDGKVVTIGGEDGMQLRIAGIWGIENARAHAPYKMNQKSIQRLRDLGSGAFDMLLTHDSPAGGHPLGGSPLITSVLRACSPSLHLFGHVPPVDDRFEVRVPDCLTSSVVLKDVSFGKEGRDSLHGSFGIIGWDGVEPCLEIVSDDWLHQMRFHNWEQVLPETISKS
jgi:Icc-related predicted phosphoesterase